MSESIVEASQYTALIDDFLRRVRENLDQKVSASPMAAIDLPIADQYWLDLNKFYYESFNEEFMPRYKQSIENDIRGLLNLNRQDSALKNNLVSTLKLFMQSFNRTKFTLRQLQQQRQEIEPHWLALQSGNDIRSVDLLYLLKELGDAWVLFSSQAEIARTLTGDEQLQTILGMYPACSLAADLFQAWEPQGPKERRLLNRLLADWQLGLKVLQKIRETHQTSKDVVSLQIEQLEAINSNWDNRKVIPAIRTWYQRNMQKTYLFYLDAVKFAIGVNDVKRTQRYTGQFHDWLQAWLNVLEECLLWESRGWGPWVRELNQLQFLDPKICRQLYDYSQKGIKSLNALIDSLSASGEANYQYHSERSRHILAEAFRWLQQETAQLNNSRFDPLTSAALHLKSQLDQSLSQLDLIDERESHAKQALKGFAELLSAMDTNIESLELTLEQMGKLISSRNLKSIFNDMNLSIEQAAIEKGSIFPAALASLAEKKLIETRTEDTAEGTVLHAEGDIFLINLEGLQYEEVPRIIIARKG